MVGPVPPPYGGIASVMEDIVSSTLSSEFAFDIFPRSAGFTEGEDFWSRNLFRLKRFFRFFRRVRHGRYSLVHIHSADPVFLGTTIFMGLARLAGSRILLHMHGTDWEWFYDAAPPLRKLYTRFGLRLADRILVLYSLWRENIERLGIRAEIDVLPNFVHGTQPPDPGSVHQMRQRLEIEEGAFVVVTVGTVGWRKGTFDILEAIPAVEKKDPTTRFILVGGEEKAGEWDQLMAIVQRDDLETFVRFTGEIPRSNIAGILALGDVFLLPSYIEGMPISIIEAMRAGLPVIASRVNAIPDLIRDGVSGILISPGDPDGIASAVLTLKETPLLRRRLAQGARKAFEERFEFAVAMARLRSVYEQMLAPGIPRCKP